MSTQQQALSLHKISFALRSISVTRDFVYRMSVRATVLACCMAQRSLVSNVTLLLLINQV